MHRNTCTCSPHFCAGWQSIGYHAGTLGVAGVSTNLRSCLGAWPVLWDILKAPQQQVAHFRLDVCWYRGLFLVNELSMVDPFWLHAVVRWVAAQHVQ